MASSIDELSWSCIMEDDDHDNQLGSGMEMLEMVNALRASLFEDSQAGVEDCSDNERLRSLIQSLEAEINKPLEHEPAGSSFMDVELQMDHDQSHNDDDHETCSSVGSLMWGQDCCTLPLDHCDIVDHDLVASSPTDDEMNNWWVEPIGDGFIHGVALRGSDFWEEAMYDLEMHQ